MAAQHPVNILLVDDEPANLHSLAAVLAELGQNLVHASSGQEALKQVLNTDFAVILLDYNMPGMTGLEVAQTIRTRPQSASTPIIFITAWDAREFPVDEAYALGAIDYLTKPVNAKVIRAKVSFFVDLYCKNEEIARLEREKHAALLNEKDAQLRLILDNTRDYAFIATDLEGSITKWEGGAEGITGWSADEAVGQPLAIIFVPEDLAAGRPDTETACARGTGRAQDTRWHLRKDGTRFFADGVMVPLKDEDGHLHGYSKIFRDATIERLAAEEARASDERYRTLFESMDQGFCIVEMLFDSMGMPVDYRFLETNPAFEKHTGLVDVIGKTVNELVPDLDRFWVDTYGRVALAGEPIRFENWADALGRWLDVYATRVGDASSKKVAILFSDITARKHAEDDLRRLAANLSEVDQRKTEFLATLAHELRNPLAPIRSGLGVMRLAGHNPEMVAKVQEMMDRQVTHMVHLIDDLLDVARISGGKLELKKERQELRDILASAVETSLPLIEAAHHELMVNISEEPMLLEADIVRIGQVVANLLNNAAKYTPPGGRIELSAYRSNGEAIISVKDNGIGIPEESLATVFDMFNQAGQNMDRSQGGLGIGLSLVRRLAEMHGGTVNATSAGFGQGSTFVVRLPLTLTQGIEDVQPIKRAVRLAQEEERKLKILVVDDNIDAAEVLSTMLGLEGHVTRVAHDGLKGLNMAKEFGPDVAFLDIGMPGMNGHETARAIRKTPGLENVVLVALTGWGADTDRALSKEAGFNHHLTKPTEFATVKALLSNITSALEAAKQRLYVVY